jgi:GNAT superfamily N-acetyltransferase
MIFHIRDAEPGDLPAVGRMAGELIRMHRDFDARRWMCPEGIEEGYARYFAGILGQPGTIILVAEEDGSRALLGYTYAGREERNWAEMREACGRLHDLFVIPSARRQGTGRALAQAGLQRLEALGETQIVFTSAWQNTTIRDLMGALGFRATSVEMTMELK